MTPQQSENGWDRYGWVAMASIWLVFLGFPLAEVLTKDALTDGQRVLGTAIIVAFALVYVHGFLQAPDEIDGSGFSLHFWALVALAVVLSPLIPGESLSTLPFIVAFAVFTLQPRWAALVMVICLSTPLLGPRIGFGDAGTEFLSVIVALVAASTSLVRFMEERERSRRGVQRDLRIVAERDRVARDVHDVLGHSLTVVAAKSELAARLVDVDPVRARTEMEQVQSLARESLAEVRAVVAGLRVTRLGDELEAASTALSAAGIEVRVDGDADVVDPRHRLPAAWVLREAVTNVVRHSGASLCVIEMGSRRLAVTDDGRGLTRAPDGNGARGVRERVAESGGEVDFTSDGDGAGTRVEVVWA